MRRSIPTSVAFLVLALALTGCASVGDRRAVHPLYELETYEALEIGETTTRELGRIMADGGWNRTHGEVENLGVGWQRLWFRELIFEVTEVDRLTMFLSPLLPFFKLDGTTTELALVIDLVLDVQDGVVVRKERTAREWGEIIEEDVTGEARGGRPWRTTAFDDGRWRYHTDEWEDWHARVRDQAARAAPHQPGTGTWAIEFRGVPTHYRMARDGDELFLFPVVHSTGFLGWASTADSAPKERRWTMRALSPVGIELPGSPFEIQFSADFTRLEITAKHEANDGRGQLLDLGWNRGGHRPPSLPDGSRPPWIP